jgi:hypothetical protein
MPSSSTPKTRSPSSPRSSRSSTSISAAASSSVAALAVKRTHRPSIPRAKKAIVGLVWPSTRWAISSDSPDSDVPHVRSVRLTIVDRSPDRASRSGSTARATISFISRGTPGTA